MAAAESRIRSHRFKRLMSGLTALGVWRRTTKRRLRLLLASRLYRAILAGVTLLSAAQPGVAGALNGQVGLSQPYPLPADALLDVQLIELLGADGSTVLRGRSRVPLTGRLPTVYILRTVDGALRANGRYRLRASIRQADRLLFSTRTAVPVVPGHHAPAPLLLEPVGDAPLRGLTWLRAPAASVPAPPAAARQEEQFRLDPLTRELTGSGDCNRFIGSFALEGDSLRLQPVGTTLLACEPAVQSDEASFMADLLKVRRWRLDGHGRLELLDEGGRRLLLMETRPL